MSIVYEWLIDKVDVYPEHAGCENVVYNIHWRVFGDNGVRRESIYGAQDIIFYTNREFIQYSELTSATLVDWVKEGMGDERVAHVEAHLSSMVGITEADTLPLPWQL